MKKVIFVLLGILLPTGVLYAQTPLPSQSVNVTVDFTEPPASCTLTGSPSDVDFGAYELPAPASATSVVINPTTDVATDPVGIRQTAAPSSGSFVVSGTHIKMISVSAAAPANLGTGLTYTHDWAWRKDGAGSFAEISSPTQFSNDSGGGIGVTETWGFRIGGTLAIPTNVTAGALSEEITYTITCSR